MAMRRLLPALAALVLSAAASQGTTAVPLANIRNCSRLPQGDDRYAFTPEGQQLKWRADPSLCLAPVSSGGCRTAAPWDCSPTAVVLRSCSDPGGDWTRVTPSDSPSGSFMLSPKVRKTHQVGPEVLG